METEIVEYIYTHVCIYNVCVCIYASECIGFLQFSNEEKIGQGIFLPGNYPC